MINNNYIKIDEISKIKGNVLNYNIFDNNIYIESNKDKYVIDYKIQYEEKLIENMTNYFNILKDCIVDKNKEIKLFQNGLIGIVFCIVLVSLLNFILPSIVPFLLNLSSLIFGLRTIKIIKDLYIETKKIEDQQSKLGVVLNSKRIDLELNHNIGILEKQEKEEIRNIINKLNELKDEIKQFNQKEEVEEKVKVKTKK